MINMDSTINKLFDSKNRMFEIPSYQRAYSWEEKQINQFIEDLKNSGNQYYLGHFLFEQKEENTLYVIDGQQRLTTCIIFFSTIKNEFEKRKNHGEQLSLNLEDITDFYLKDLRKETQKFKTVRDDNNFFMDEIIDGKTHSSEFDTSSKKRIREAKEIFEKEFSKTTIGDLVNWYKLVEKATITEYIVKDKIQATQVFAFQNDRGKKLSNLEIIKAYFMLQIYLSSNSPDKIKDDIVYLEGEISRIYKQIVLIKLDEDEVLNYYWRAVSGKGFYSEEVVKGIKERITSLTTEKKGIWIKEFVLGLSQAFKTVENIEKSTEGHIQDLLYLKNMALAYPFIIKAYGYNATDKQLNRLIKLFENITFRYLLRGGRAEIESRLNGYLVNFKSADDIDKNINGIIESLKNNDWWRYWSDKEMVAYLNGYFYKNRVDNYLLWKYELFISNENYPKPHKISFIDLIRNESIEHIAPKTSTNGDPVANGYGIYENKEKPEEGIVSGEWLNRLGNLMLISQSHNSSIGNKPFREKLASYGRDNLLNQQKEIGEKFVSDKSNPIWDKQAIEKRQFEIIKAANEIWNLENI